MWKHLKIISLFSWRWSADKRISKYFLCTSKSERRELYPILGNSSTKKRKQTCARRTIPPPHLTLTSLITAESQPDGWHQQALWLLGNTTVSGQHFWMILLPLLRNGTESTNSNFMAFCSLKKKIQKWLNKGQLICPLKRKGC